MQVLLQALNQDNIKNPYVFNTTGISVCSFEEALYHCYYYWQGSVDDYLSDAFIDWVNNTLNLPDIASRITKIRDYPDFAAGYAAFLQITPYFDKTQIKKIGYELDAWEAVAKWENLKKLADEYNEKGDAKNAIPLYERILENAEDVSALNNAAVCLMKTGQYTKSFALLERAYTLSPDNTDILLNFTEAAIYSHSFNKAIKLLAQSAQLENRSITAHIDFLHGELNYETGNIKDAAAYMKKAADASGDDFYKYRLSEVYIALRMYDEAFAVLEKAEQTVYCLIKKAETHKHTGHIPAAVRCIEKALALDNNNTELWITLAGYYRMNYNHKKALAAVTRALDTDPANEQAMLEHARIYKAMGETVKYYEILSDILDIKKAEYRNFRA